MMRKGGKSLADYNEDQFLLSNPEHHLSHGDNNSTIILPMDSRTVKLNKPVYTSAASLNKSNLN